MANVDQLLREADALIVIPPFSSLEYTNLGPPILQACARTFGMSVHILYANIHFAKHIGTDLYYRICRGSVGAMIGERMFARTAYDLPPLGYNSHDMFNPSHMFGSEKSSEITFATQTDNTFFYSELLEAEESIKTWVMTVAESIALRDYRVVGCTSMFEQTAASISLLNAVKDYAPELVTIIGGANCEGEMAEGVAKLSTKIDHVFAGESEATFPDFLRKILSGERPNAKIIRGRPCDNLDALPTPDFTNYFEQLESLLPDLISESAISYETSRGCWWGQKHHCTFCGLNGEGMGFRRKSADKVFDNLKSFHAKYPTRKVQMVDNIMPFEYFRTLLPRLVTELPSLEIFYEQKANLTLDKVLLLMDAGITEIQPGIEALSTELLRIMDKGVSARQNIMLLRYGRACGMNLIWGLLRGFPGDHLAIYQETLDLVKLIHHLQPPSGVYHISIDRFSPYFSRSEAYGVHNVRPFPVYNDILPKDIATEVVAYHFLADYQSGSYEKPDLIRSLHAEIKTWQSSWRSNPSGPPELRVCLYKGYHLLVDTRGIPGTEKVEVLDRDRAVAILNAHPYSGTKEEVWAIERRAAVVLDSWFVPLAVASPDLLAEYETEFSSMHGTSIGKSVGIS